MRENTATKIHGDDVCVVHLWILRCHVHRSGDEEGVIAAGDGVVKAAFLVEIGSKDRQRPKLPQALEVGVLLHVIWDDSESSKAIKDSRPILNMCGVIHNPVKLADYV